MISIAAFSIAILRIFLSNVFDCTNPIYLLEHFSHASQFKPRNGILDSSSPRSYIVNDERLESPPNLHTCWFRGSSNLHTCCVTVPSNPIKRLSVTGEWFAKLGMKYDVKAAEVDSPDKGKLGLNEYCSGYEKGIP